MIVDDLKLVNSKEKTINSKLNACFLESHLDFQTFAPEGSLARTIAKKLDPARPCFILNAMQSGPKNSEIFKDKLFFFPSLFLFVLRFLAYYRRQDMFLSLQNPLISGNLNFYLSKKIDTKLRNVIDELWVVPLMEQGHFQKMFSLFEIEMTNEFPLMKNTIFTSPNEFIDAHTFVSDVRFNEFKAFFYLHLLLLLLFSVSQTAFLSIKLALKISRFRRL